MRIAFIAGVARWFVPGTTSFRFRCRYIRCVMIHVQVSAKKLWDHQSDAFVFLIDDMHTRAADLGEIEKSYYPHLLAILKKNKFEGKAGQLVVLTAPKGDAIVHFIFAGYGKNQ